MDHKSWLWLKRPSEKTIFSTDKAEELVMIPKEGGQNNAAKNPNEKFASVLLDPHSNGGNVKKHVKVADTANAGQENVEAEVLLLKRELDEALRREMVANEMLSCSDAALRERMQELDFVRREQEEMIREAVMNASKEFEMVERDLEERLAQLTAENSHLSNALLVKEKALQDQQKHKSRTEAEFSTLMARLDSVEKENVFLKYECRVMEKDVEIRNEEMEYNRRSAYAAQRQSLETAKEVAKLEAECQRLHLALRKRPPGPAGIRISRKANGARDFIDRDHFAAEDMTRNLHLLVEQLQNVEAENRNLKEIVIKKDAELHQSLELIHSQPLSRISSNRSLTSDYSEGKFKPLPGNKVIEVPEMRLMDDFAEMERLAIVSTDAAAEGGSVPLMNEQRELISDPAESFDWLQAVLQAMMKQKCISKRSLGDLLEDIKIALGCGAYACNGTTNRMHSLEQDPHDVRGYITWKGSNMPPTEEPSSGTSSNKLLSDRMKDEQAQPEVKNAVSKIIQLIEGIDVKSVTNDNTSGDYSFHVLQWRTSELCAILERFVCTCKKQLGTKADLREFAEEVSFALDYILNNCLNPKQASNTRDKIKRHFGWNNSQCKNETETAHVSEQQSSCAPADDSSMHIQQEENRGLQDELESTAGNSNTLTMQLQEAEATIGGLKKELKKLQEEKETMEDQINDQRSINEDLDTQLTVLKSKLNGVFQKCSSLEIELEYKNNCCEELEATCLELQLQLESVARKEQSTDHERSLTQDGWEITAASVKLAECQETILNLGKQLKVLASPREAVLYDRMFSNGHPGNALTNSKRMIKHFSLHDQMQADDAAKAERLGSPETRAVSGNKGVFNVLESRSSRDLQAQSALVRVQEAHLGSRREGGNNAAMALAIVPSKKPGFSLLRKLLFRKKRGSGIKLGC